MTRNISSKYEVKPLVFIGWTKDMGCMKNGYLYFTCGH